MKLFGYSFGARKSGSAMDVLRELLGQSTSASGAKVNWKSAQQAVTAMRCARVIAEGLAQVPFKLYRERDDGGKDAAKGHTLYRLVALQPNEWQTSFEFREQIALHLVFCGNAFVWKNRVRGNIVELLPYEPQCVTVKRDGWDVIYEVTTAGGQRITIPRDEMWHLRGISWDGVQGLEGVKLAREAIGLAMTTEKHGSKLFANGAQPGGLLSTDSVLNPEQRTALRADWQATHGGTGNAFKTAVLWGGMKWQDMSSRNDQAQFLETRRFQVEEVCRAFGVMPIMAGFSDKAATYASAEQMFIAHVVHCLGPWYARIEQSAAVNLLTEAEQDEGYYFKFVANGLMRGAVKDRVEYFRGMYGIGALNPNEIRALDDFNPYEGGEKYRVPLNMVDPNTIPTDTGKGTGDVNATP